MARMRTGCWIAVLMACSIS
ncbi:MAG: hypothetical protein EPO60_06535, partial [Rugosibacter sp.]